MLPRRANLQHHDLVGRDLGQRLGAGQEPRDVLRDRGLVRDGREAPQRGLQALALRGVEAQ